MNPSRYRAIHRYGAVLSIAAILISILAFLIGGPLSRLGPPLGLLGPLFGFYFIGAVLDDYPRYRILGEELMRGIVWYGGSLLAWSIILTSSSVLPTTSFTAFGLPAVTALGLSLMMVGIRSMTGLDLKVQTEGGQLLIAVTGGVVGGFLVLYFVLVDGQSPMLGLLYVFATVGGLVFWRRHWQGNHTG